MSSTGNRHGILSISCVILLLFHVTKYCRFISFLYGQFGKDEKLGMCKISLKKLTPGTEVITDNLIKTMEPNGIQNDKSAGEITLELTYKPFKEGNIQKEDPGGLLYVVVHEAKELEGKCNTNPYVKLTFKGVEKKTKVLIFKILCTSVQYHHWTMILSHAPQKK